MSKLPPIFLHRRGTARKFNGSWYRGEHTNFIPSKEDLAQPDAVDEYVIQGWKPEAPFISKETPVTAFGSCFAAHISELLSSKGYTLLGRELGNQAHIVRFGEGIVNTFAIRQQLEWGLGRREFPENLWFGPHKEIASIDPAIRHATGEMIQTTEVFIITLGVSEIWYDRRSGEAFWRAIPATMFDPTLHGFRVSTVEENLENLRATVALIREARPLAKVVFTLSPIPLMATFRPISCVTASSVSKAVLRVALDLLMQDASAGVYYFPAYEIVRDFFADPFKDDNRHPRDEVVDFVMQAFQRHYCAD